MEDIHGEKDEEQGIKVNWPNKKIEEVKEHHLDEDGLIPHIVAPCGACRAWIFFINGVLWFLKMNGSGMEKEERWLEMPAQGEDKSRTSSPPKEAMDKSLKVGEDEWRERERRRTKFYASNEV